MKKLIWTNTALEDVERIKQNIEQDSIIYADRYTRNFLDKITLLTGLPELEKPLKIGEKFDKMNFREKLISNYNVIYLVEDGGIYIITVVHTARDRKHIRIAVRNFYKMRKDKK